MRTQVSIAAAVAAVLASHSAFALDPAASIAAPIQLVVSGASAQRDTFRDVLQDTGDGLGLCTVGSFNSYVASDGVSSTSEDFRAYSCTLKSADPDVTDSIEGQNVTVYYRSEGGSVFGVGPLLAANPTFSTGVKRLEITNDGNCSLNTVTYTCSVAGYVIATDTIPTANRLTDDPTELGVSDVEPVIFKNAVHWPSPSVLGAVPSGTQLTQLNSLNTSAVQANGTAFGIAVSNNGVTTGVTNLSRQAVASIFGQGGSTAWGDVENSGAVGTATPIGTAADTITVCRREPGSGTQVTAAVYFLNQGCPGTSVAFRPGNGTNVIENNTTAQLQACLATPGSIGIMNVQSPPSDAALNQWHFVSLDGVAATKQNAALGRYGYAFEVTMQTRSGLPAADNALATDLRNGSRRAAHQSTSATASSFALPIAGVNTPSIANAQGTQPIAIGTRSKNSCRPFLSVL